MGTSRPDKILLDTNCYLRLGRRLVPLFGRAWGNPPSVEFCVHRDAKMEYFHNPGIRSKFDWVLDEPWLNDLKAGKVRLGQKQKDSILDLLDYLEDTTRSLALGCSDIDRRCLATAMELGVPLATDDRDLQTLAKEFDAPILGSLQVLKLLLDRSAVPIESIREIVLQWQADNDFRPRFWKEYKDLFSEDTPRL